MGTANVTALSGLHRLLDDPDATDGIDAWMIQEHHAISQHQVQAAARREGWQARVGAASPTEASGTTGGTACLTDKRVSTKDLADIPGVMDMPADRFARWAGDRYRASCSRPSTYGQRAYPTATSCWSSRSPDGRGRSTGPLS